MYSMIEGRLVEVYQPEDAKELMSLIEKANNDGKKYYLNASRGEIRIDSGIQVPANLREVFEDMASQIERLSSGKGKAKGKTKSANMSSEAQAQYERYNSLRDSILAGNTKLAADDKKFLQDLYGKKLEFKARGRKHPAIEALI